MANGKGNKGGGGVSFLINCGAASLGEYSS